MTADRLFTDAEPSARAENQREAQDVETWQEEKHARRGEE